MYLLSLSQVLAPALETFTLDRWCFVFTQALLAVLSFLPRGPSVCLHLEVLSG